MGLLDSSFVDRHKSVLKVHISPAASDRLAAATSFVSAFPPSTEILVVAASRLAADDFVRHYSSTRKATFGLHRFSLVQLAARIAALRLAASGQVPCSTLGFEATVVRAVYETHDRGGLQYFSSVASLPGFAKAVPRNSVGIAASRNCSR